MRVLVTGANGFVGRALLDTFETAGHEAVPCVRHAVGIHGERSIGTIDAFTDWASVLDGCEAVIHLAARVHVMNDVALDPLHEFRQTNVDGTLNLARQAAAAGVNRFIFLSSIKVNGESTAAGMAFTSNSTPRPEDPYSVSKWEAEQGLRKVGAATGMEVVIIRPPLVYGKGVGANFAQLVRLVRKKWPLPFGAIDNRRSYIAIENLIDFVLCCVSDQRAAGEIFLVSDGADISTAELVRCIASAEGREARLWPVPVWILKTVTGLFGRRQMMNRLCGNLQIDISKAIGVMDWQPIIGMNEALKKMMQG
jgi:nucleoside-diphosphate-sugar epimerase